MANSSTTKTITAHQAIVLDEVDGEPVYRFPNHGARRLTADEAAELRARERAERMRDRYDR